MTDLEVPWNVKTDEIGCWMVSNNDLAASPKSCRVKCRDFSMLIHQYSLTCRRRKLKCDEKKPECGQCRKASRVCEPSELVFRHQQNSSINRESDKLGGYYGQKNIFDGSNTWLAIPKQGES